MTKLNNPLQIDRIQLTKTKDGKPIISCYSNPLEFPALTLFQSQFGELITVGIDPNALPVGQDYYTHFLAHWEETEKRNQKGNAYKNVARLETAVSTTDPVLAELRAIRELLAELVGCKETAVSGKRVVRKARPKPKPKKRAETAVSQPSTPALPDFGKLALEATTAEAFDYAAFMKLQNGLYTEQQHITKTRVMLFPKWQPGSATNAAVLEALEVYRDKRQAALGRGDGVKQAHDFAAIEAKNRYHRLV